MLHTFEFVGEYPVEDMFLSYHQEWKQPQTWPPYPKNTAIINPSFEFSHSFCGIIGSKNINHVSGLEDINLLKNFFLAYVNTILNIHHSTGPYYNYRGSPFQYMINAIDRKVVSQSNDGSLTWQDTCFMTKKLLNELDHENKYLSPGHRTWIEFFKYFLKINLPRDDILATLANMIYMHFSCLLHLENLVDCNPSPFNENSIHKRFNYPNFDAEYRTIELISHRCICFPNDVPHSLFLFYKWGKIDFCIQAPLCNGNCVLGHKPATAHFFNEHLFEKFPTSSILLFQDTRVAEAIQKQLDNDKTYDPREFIISSHLGYDLSPFKWNYFRGHNVIFIPAPTIKSLGMAKVYREQCKELCVANFTVSSIFVLRGEIAKSNMLASAQNEVEKYISNNFISINDETNPADILNTIKQKSLPYLPFNKLYTELGLFKPSQEYIANKKQETFELPRLDPRLLPPSAYKLPDVTANHILRPKNIIMVSGLKDAGKTQIGYLLIRSALQIETQIPTFCKFSPASLGNVCLVDAETPIDELEQNFITHDLKQFIDNKLFVFSKFTADEQKLPSGFDLSDVEFQNALKSKLAQYNCRLLILDNLTALMGDKIDNSSHANAVINWIDSLQKLDICVVLIMHKSVNISKIDKDRNRGSRIFKDRSRVILNLISNNEIKVADEENNIVPQDAVASAKKSGLTVGLQFTTFKTAPVFTNYTIWAHLPFGLTWELICVTDNNGISVNTAELISNAISDNEEQDTVLQTQLKQLEEKNSYSLTEKQRKVFFAVSHYGEPASTGQIAKAFTGQKGFGEDTIRTILVELAEHNFLENINTAKNPKYIVTAVPPVEKSNAADQTIATVRRKRGKIE